MKKGDYYKAHVSSNPADLNSKEATDIKKKISYDKDEAVYIYSFKKNQILFAAGFQDLIGYPDNEVNVMNIYDIYDSKYSTLLHHFTDQTLHFLHHNKINGDFSTYAISNIYNKITNTKLTIIKTVSVYEKNENNNFISGIVRFKKIENLKYDSVFQYGIVDSSKKINLFTDNIIDFEVDNSVNIHEIKLLELLDNNMSINSISKHFECSETQINLAINNILARFKCKNTQELINFSKQNEILPNQFNLIM